ncbi:MAG: hypothetical protein AB7V27_18220 [Candidatus Binatia bacterium]
MTAEKQFEAIARNAIQKMDQVRASRAQYINGLRHLVEEGRNALELAIDTWGEEGDQ